MTITRCFFDWNRPFLPQVADYLTNRYARGTTLDLTGVILVFPGRRAARRMLELLVERSEQNHPNLLPPQMHTFETFPELLYVQRQRLADPLTERLVWKQALTAVPSETARAALSHLPSADALSNWLRLCESLRQQHQELAAEGLDFSDVQVLLEQKKHDEEAARWQALRTIQAEYLCQMDRLNLWDRQTARLYAVDQEECETSHDILLVGTVDMSRLVERMLLQVADRVTALVFAPESLHDHFDAFGRLRSELWQDRQIAIPEDTAVIADDPDGQAAAVAEHLAAQNGTWRADDICVAVADEMLVPAVEQALSQAGLRTRWPVRFQVRNSAPWRLLEAVARHLATAQTGQPGDFESLSDLVRHPDVSEALDQALAARGFNNTTWLADLDEYLAGHLPPHPGVLPESRRQGVVRAICRTVEDLLSELVTPNEERPSGTSGRSAPQSVYAASSGRQPLADWAAGCLRLLQRVCRFPDPDCDASRYDAFSACMAAFNRACESLQDLPADMMPQCTASQALPVLLMQTADADVPAPPDDEAVELTGWLEVPLDDSPVVTVAGFNEGRIPRSVTSDLFLPNTLRAELGLNDNRRRYARDAWALESLLHSRPSVRLIAGRRDDQGDPLHPSRLWLAGSVRETADRVCRFYEDTAPDSAPPDTQRTEQRDVPESSIGCRPAATGGESAFIVPSPDARRPAPAKLAVTDFREFLACPYRYYLKKELKLTAVDHRPDEMNALTFGVIIHRVLSRFAETDLVDSDDSARIRAGLQDLLSQEATHQFGTQYSSTVAVQLEIIAERLREFARWQAEQIRDGWRIRWTEQAVETDFQDIRGRTVLLTGRIDRIDQHSEQNIWRILDYKTGDKAKSPKETHYRSGRDEWTDLQLPLYHLLARQLPLQGDIQLGYMHLPGDLSNVRETLATWDAEQIESAIQAARQTAADILDMTIETVTPPAGNRSDEFSRICQDTVVDRRIPWLDDWTGRLSKEGES